MTESKCQSTDFGTSFKGVKSILLFGPRPQNSILVTFRGSFQKFL